METIERLGAESGMQCSVRSLTLDPHRLLMIRRRTRRGLTFPTASLTLPANYLRAKMHEADGPET
jgi:hypothetical protein